MQRLIQRAVKELSEAKKAVALTGAGMSVESGIPAFRGEGGLWERYDPEEYATIEAFKRDPARCWRMLKELGEALLKARPNPGHLALAELEKMGFLSSVITQNIDGLHQEAGNTDVIELHGNGRRLLCLSCGRRFETLGISLEELPPKCRCGGILKPDVVFFGELISESVLYRARREAETCDVMLVIGTSAMVYPAAGLPGLAKSSGSKVIEINPQRTVLTDSISDYLITGSAGQIMPLLVNEIKVLTT
ncbi:MAG TPA: NAD-dependent deacylase [Candidatus Latescibacteria bacterium]|nr:NAD-dependent deacylase [Candidatus Latescibacterota bacterium]